jgi:hypothetical protein
MNALIVTLTRDTLFYEKKYFWEFFSLINSNDYQESSWGYRAEAREVENLLTTICEPRNVGSLDVSQSYEPPCLAIRIT